MSLNYYQLKILIAYPFFTTMPEETISFIWLGNSAPSTFKKGEKISVQQDPWRVRLQINYSY